MKVLVINGPNLNMLGKREKTYYGTATLESIVKQLRQAAKKLRVSIDFYQSNIEGELIEHIQKTDADGIIINAGAYTHTSIAIRDALSVLGKPIVEVHLSNIFAREQFRHFSYISEISIGIVAGFKEDSYLLAFQGLYNYLRHI